MKKQTQAQLLYGAYFFRTIGMTLRSEAEMGPALEVAKTDFPEFGKQIDKALKDLNNGEEIWPAFVHESLPTFVPHMLNVGIESGLADQACIDIGDLLKRTADMEQAELSPDDISQVHFTRIMGTLIGYGTPIRIVLQTLVRADIHKDAGTTLWDTIREGYCFEDGFGKIKNGHIDRASQTYIILGENIGALGELCLKASQLRQAVLVKGRTAAPVPEYAIDRVVLYDLLTEIHDFDMKKNMYEGLTAKNHDLLQVVERLMEGKDLSDALDTAGLENPVPKTAILAIKTAETQGAVKVTETLRNLASLEKWRLFGIEDPLLASSKVLA
jgi:type II secretory pathway component PulF